MAKNNYTVPALEKGMKLLEFLADYPAGLTMSEMTDTAIPTATLYRMLTTFVQLGYISKDDNDRYRLNRKLLSLAYKSIDENSIIEKALPFMRELRNLVNETVMLGTLYGNEGVVLESVKSHQAICVSVKIGHHFPLHTAAPAKAMLACLDPQELSDILDNTEFTKFTDTTITSKNVYLAELESVRKNNYAFDFGEEHPDLRCAASAICGANGQMLAAIWIAAPSSRTDRKNLEQIAIHVKSTAEKIQSVL